MNKKGFSLIELVTVIAIIGIMSAILFVSLIPARSSKDLENAARQFTTDIRALQRSALNGTRPSGVTVSVCGHGVNVNGSSDTYRLFAVQKSGGVSDCLSGVGKTLSRDGDEYATKTFESGVTVEMSDASDIYFQVPDAKVFVNNSVASGSVTFTFEKGSESCDVEMSQTGEITSNEC